MEDDSEQRFIIRQEQDRDTEDWNQYKSEDEESNEDN